AGNTGNSVRVGVNERSGGKAVAAGVRVGVRSTGSSPASRSSGLISTAARGGPAGGKVGCKHTTTVASSTGSPKPAPGATALSGKGGSKTGTALASTGGAKGGTAAAARTSGTKGPGARGATAVRTAGGAKTRTGTVVASGGGRPGGITGKGGSKSTPS